MGVVIASAIAACIAVTAVVWLIQDQPTTFVPLLIIGYVWSQHAA